MFAVCGDIPGRNVTVGQWCVFGIRIVTLIDSIARVWIDNDNALVVYLEYAIADMFAHNGGVVLEVRQWTVNLRVGGEQSWQWRSPMVVVTCVGWIPCKLS